MQFGSQTIQKNDNGSNAGEIVGINNTNPQYGLDLTGAQL